jgi:hypothetical protein
MAIFKKDIWSEKVYESKLERFGSALFKLIYFAVTTSLLYYAFLVDAEWLPPVLFGTGDIKQVFGKGNAMDTMRPHKKGFASFYLICAGYHLGEVMFQVAFELDRPDFKEMLAHHVTTAFLLYASYESNFVRIGSLVLFVHYASDIPVYAAKVFVDTSMKTMTFLCLLAMLVSWGYLRLYAFPKYIIRASVVYTGHELEIWGPNALYINFAFSGSLFALFCLHCYWYCLFLRMGYRHLFKGETKDMQANLNAAKKK